MKEFIVRHGDLLIKRIEKLPEGLIQQNDNIVALGEFTGHNHTLSCKKLSVLNDVKGNKYLNIEKDTSITHQEHKTLEIPQGLYTVIIEQEFDPFAGKIRSVKD